MTSLFVFSLGYDCDTVICTTDKKLMTFFKGYLIKSCTVDINVKHLEPYITYEPKLEVYYILHGDNKVVIVKEGTSLEVCIIFINIIKSIYLFVRIVFRLLQHILIYMK